MARQISCGDGIGTKISTACTQHATRFYAQSATSAYLLAPLIQDGRWTFLLFLFRRAVLVLVLRTDATIVSTYNRNLRAQSIGGGSAPLPGTRQLKESNSAREKTPPHTRGGIRANKTQNPPFSHTPNPTRMKILPFLTPLNTHTHTHTSSHTLAVAFNRLHYITWQLPPSALCPLIRPLPPRSAHPRPPPPSCRQTRAAAAAPVAATAAAAASARLYFFGSGARGRGGAGPGGAH